MSLTHRRGKWQRQEHQNSGPSQKMRVTSFESWRQNLIYILSLDINFMPFLSDIATWQKKTAANPTRGLADDVAPIPADQRKSATLKNTHLDLMLGQIANYCTVIARSTTVKGSMSLTDIW